MVVPRLHPVACQFVGFCSCEHLRCSSWSDVRCRDRSNALCQGTSDQHLPLLCRARKRGQIGAVHVRDGPERHSVADPMTKVESTNGPDEIASGGITGLRRDEYVDDMALALIDQPRNWPPTHVIEAA